MVELFDLDSRSVMNLNMNSYLANPVLGDLQAEASVYRLLKRARYVEKIREIQ